MNANFGLFPPLDESIRNKKERNESIALRALEHVRRISIGLHERTLSSK
jgi:methylenetetrahydrofolate--tRNA-(uracil-5-)-methyltransferase